MKNFPILDKVMQLYGEVKSSSPFLHFIICQPFIDSLPSTSLRSPSLSTLPSFYLSLLLPCLFCSSLYPSFPTNLTCPYFSSYLPIHIPSFLLPHPSLFFCYPSPFPLLFSSPFPFISPLFLSPFYSLFISLFLPLSLLLGGREEFYKPLKTILTWILNSLPPSQLLAFGAYSAVH